ncbi:MAG TPA: MaoC/PaaZ C-terminal domain-containing protein [Jatrophihabitantaceae bacterium]|nr:MaoC/PaaZ C-terminal domain-containing protein [Jatrophihabitantaceae bacterium]
MFDRYYDELTVGDKREFSAITITETHVVNFAGVTGDHFGLHMDSEYAKTTPFKQRVAHGLLVLSCGAGLIPILPGRMLAFLGMDQVRFTAPVFIGDTVHPVMEILDKSEKAPGGVVTIAETIVNQRGETVITATIRIWVGNKAEAA